MTIIQIASDVVRAHHGWAVAEQFDDTVADTSEKNLCVQNLRALELILESIQDLIDSRVFTKDAETELRSYVEEVSSYLNDTPVDKLSDI